MPPFDLQGHRGARGLRPENTLPSFEAALDAGVTSIETDVHLTRDGVPVLIHDPRLSPRIHRPDSHHRALVCELTLSELRRYRADGNPDPQRFPTQTAEVSPRARGFAERHGFDVYAIPTLANLLEFVAGHPGVRIDVELKRVPFRPELIGDDFDGVAPGLLERQVVETLRAAGMIERATVRSFDHRSLRAIRTLAPEVTTGLLIAETAVLSPSRLAREAGADMYCPDLEFLDEAQVRDAHAAGMRVIPWTVNEPADWQRLLAWGVDGITTDYPDRLAAWLSKTAPSA
jgi:glycerophosphoryl diester phosphodiesterase